MTRDVYDGNMDYEAELVASLLIDTDREVDDVLNEEGIDPMWFEFYGGYDVLYDTVFRCSACGLWSSTADMNELGEDVLCADCLYLEVHQD